MVYASLVGSDLWWQWAAVGACRHIASQVLGFLVCSARTAPQTSYLHSSVYFPALRDAWLWSVVVAGNSCRSSVCGQAVCGMPAPLCVWRLIGCRVCVCFSPGVCLELIVRWVCVCVSVGWPAAPVHHRRGGTADSLGAIRRQCLTNCRLPGTFPSVFNTS